MLDYQRVVEDLRNALYAASANQPQSLPAAAAAFGQACNVVNERLRTCGALLRQGLRSEAIQQCELEPNLLDLVAMLDFPERQQLPEFLLYFNLPAVPNLLLDEAALLNEAYAAQQPLEALLEQHRLLALARGPLNRRIGVLRQIAELDMNNPIWREDIALFEAERLSQIQRELNRAAKANDRETLEALRKEVATSPWQTTPPSNLRKQIEKALEDAWQQESRSRLEELEPQLNDAFAALDVASARRLREYWEVNARRCQLDDSDPLAQRAAPALDWLAEQDAREHDEQSFQAAVAALEQALDGQWGGTSISKARDETAELERRYAVVVRFGREVPLHLERRYRTRMLALEDGQRRRFRLLVGAAVCLLLAAGGGVAVLLMRASHEREVAGHAAILARFLENDSLQEASRHIEQLQQQQPKVAQAAAVREQVLLLEQRLQEEQQRADDFRQAMADVSGSGYESPNRQALDRARQLAKTPAEKAEVTKAEGEIVLAMRRTQEQRDQRFLADFQPLAQQVAALAMTTFSTPEEELAHLRQLQSDLQALDARSKQVTPELRQQMPPLFTRIKSGMDRIMALQEEELVLERVARNADNDFGYLSALQTYIDAYSNTARAESFRKVIAESASWKEFDAWNEVASWWNGQTMKQLTPALATEMINRVATYQKSHEQWPLAAELKQQADAIQCIANRHNAQGEPVTQALRTLLLVPLHSDCYVVHLDEGTEKVLYVQSLPSTQGMTQVKLDVYINRQGETKNRSPLVKAIKQAGPAPQTVVAKAILAQLDNLNKASEPAAWERTFCEILEAIARARDVDPMLTMMLLKETMQVAGQGSDQLKALLAPHYKLLDESRADPFANWVDPDDKAADAARRQSDIDLNQVIPRLLPELAKLRQSLPEYKVTPAPRYARLGWLRRNQKNQWQLMSNDLAAETNGTLFVLQAIEGQPPKLIIVGSVRAGAVELNSLADEGLVEGRPVWLQRAS